MFRAKSCLKHIELILEINKIVVVASSWFSYIILPTLMMHGQTQVKFAKLCLIFRNIKSSCLLMSMNRRILGYCARESDN